MPWLIAWAGVESETVYYPGILHVYRSINTRFDLVFLLASCSAIKADALRNKGTEIDLCDFECHLSHNKACREGYSTSNYTWRFLLPFPTRSNPAPHLKYAILAGNLFLSPYTSTSEIRTLWYTWSLTMVPFSIGRCLPVWVSIGSAQFPLPEGCCCSHLST